MSPPQNIIRFLFEVGTMRRLMRKHNQLLLTNDATDNIASHSFRVAFIGYFLAKMERVDWRKVVMMCLLHDTGEARTGDHNWVNKRYVSEHETQVLKEQLGLFSELTEIAAEYAERKTPEAIVAKDADILDQVMLVREYAWQGNKEAEIWLEGKKIKRPYAYLDYVTTESAKVLGRAIYDEDPSSWWRNLYTNQRQ